VTSEKPREIAVRVLRRWDEGSGFLEDLLEAELDQTAVTPADRRLIQELTYGVVRWRATLDWLISRKTGDRPQNPLLRLLLRLGLYQVFWLDRIPDHAIVHETVEMAKRLGLGRRSGFVNAVLRGFLREQAEIEGLLEGLKSSQPALGYSHPDWLHDRWCARWGTKTAAQLMEWNNQRARIFARVNSLRTDPENLLDQWHKEGVQAEAFSRDWIQENLVWEIAVGSGLATLPSFLQGLFYIQDPSTLLAVEALNPQPDEHILDLCAAPGGKTTFMAQKMSNRGRIVACDAQPDRLARLRENCARLGVTCVEAVAETLALDAPHAALFDRILVDAPCSNTGVMQRRVDLRWRMRPEEIGRLRRIQLGLLHQAAERLKPQGSLVYSTCSLEAEENREVVNEFLTAHGNFTLESERELQPFHDAVDGAYVARLKGPA